MRYSLLAGGKRIRPVLALATAHARRDADRGGAPARRRARADPHLLADPRRPAGDGRRRRCAAAGRRATSVTARTIAILAGDAPLRRGAPAGARTSSAATRRGSSPRLPSWRPRPACSGMVGGQYIDVAALVAAGDASLRRLHELKTGRLIGAAVECVLLLDRRARPAPLHCPTSVRSPRSSGVLFQIVDDILDVTGTDVALGKPQGSDERHGKVTYVSRYGLDGARDHGRRIAPQRPRRARPGGTGAERTSSSRSPTSSPPAPHDHCSRPHRPPAGPARPLRGRAAAGRAGGPRAADRHGGGDRRPLRRQPRHVRDRGRAALAARLAARQDPLGRRPPGLPAQDPHRPPRRSSRTIRKYGGLAPFCSIHESEHDIMGAGHASTSIGYAVGIKEAMRARRRPSDGKVVAVIGDGAMTGGVAFEAIHQAGGLGTPLVVVLNDNGMSIAPNVGALSRYFNRVRLEPGPVEGARGRRGEAHEAAGRHRRARSSASARSSRSRSRRSGRPACGGRSSTGPTWASSTATTCARCAARCAPRSRPSGPSSSTARRSRARASRPPRTAASRAWRSGMPPSRTRSRKRMPRAVASRVEQAARRRSTRRSSARRWCASASATSASSASPPR